MGKELLELIRKKQEAIAQLQAELDEARAILNGNRGRSIKELAAGAGKPAGPRLRIPASPKRAKSTTVSYKSDSSVGRAVEVLRDHGKPLHIDEMIARIEQRGYKVNKSTLVGMISAYVKRKVLFQRVKPNTFGLLEWRKEGLKQ